ncbi:hypothetical protein DRI50_03225 [candidate division KSB1 bacterium]|nr:MAG: hypothetical protein DRI50_03225 [candidate division KSB1 bacterium]
MKYTYKNNRFRIIPIILHQGLSAIISNKNREKYLHVKLREYKFSNFKLKSSKRLIMEQVNSSNVDQKKQQILKAASHLIAKFGYDKTTLDDIANLIKIKKTTLYYYYRNKDEIVQEVVRSETDRYLKELKENLDKQKSAHSKIREYIRTKMNCMKEMLNIYDLSKQRFLEISSKIHSMISNVLKEEEQLLSGIIKDGMKNKELKSCDAQKIAEAIVAISEAVKYKELYNTNMLSLSDKEFSKMESDINYILSLVFDGLENKE